MSVPAGKLQSTGMWLSKSGVFWLGDVGTWDAAAGSRVIQLIGNPALDFTPPTASLSLSPTTPSSGWYSGDVSVSLTATEEAGGSGVKEIRYSVDMGAEQVVAGASGSFTISSEGVHTIAYWSIDNAGNVESTQYATVKIDKTAPTVEHALSNGVLTLAGSDALSGVDWVKFKIDNGTEQTYTGPVTLPVGARVVIVRARDIAGNVSAAWNVAVGPVLKGLAFTPPSSVYAGSSLAVRVDLLTPAPAGGLVVGLSSNLPGVLPLPSTVTVSAGALSVSTSVVAGPVSTDAVATVTATVGDHWVARSVAVLVPVPKSLVPTPSVVTGGSNVNFNLTLVSKAPTGGQVVELESLDPSVLSVPSSTTVSAGALVKTFTATTSPSSADRSVLVLAKADGDIAVGVVVVRRIAVKSASFSPSSVTGGATAELAFRLDRPAPAGGMVVPLQVSGSGASVPSTVTVPAGQTSAKLTVSTSAVSMDTATVVRAQLGGGSVRATLALNAPRLSTLTFSPSAVKGGGISTGIVVLTGRAPAGGTTVRLSMPAGAPVSAPSSVTIPAGSTNATFVVQTSAVTTNTPVPVSASLNLESKTANLTVGR